MMKKYKLEIMWVEDDNKTKKKIIEIEARDLMHLSEMMNEKRKTARKNFAWTEKVR